MRQGPPGRAAARCSSQRRLNPRTSVEGARHASARFRMNWLRELESPPRLRPGGEGDGAVGTATGGGHRKHTNTTCCSKPAPACVGAPPERVPSLFGAGNPFAKALIERQALCILDLPSELSGTCQYRNLAPIQANGEPLQADALCGCMCEDLIFFVRPRHFTSPASVSLI